MPRWQDCSLLCIPIILKQFSFSRLEHLASDEKLRIESLNFGQLKRVQTLSHGLLMPIRKYMECKGKMHEPVTFLSERAYQAFKNEIVDQLKTAGDFLQGGGVELSKEEMQELKVIFHRMKGGAGFLGFREIEICAAELQKLVEDTLTGATQQLSLATDILGEIELLAKALPESSTSSQG